MTGHYTTLRRLAGRLVALAPRMQRAASQSMCGVWVAGAVLACATLTSCSGAPPNPNPLADVPLKVASVDLPRYMGRWYVIANIPYFAERGYRATAVSLRSAPTSTTEAFEVCHVTRSLRSRYAPVS